MFNTYVLENEPIDKWATFKEFNDASEEASSFGFDFNLEPVSSQVAGFRYILDEFGIALYTGSVDPDEYLPKLLEKLDDAGVQKVIDEMQRQVAERTGLPYSGFDGDQADPRNFTDAQFETRVQGLVEVMEERKNMGGVN